MLGIWKDPARFQATYFEPLKHGPLQDRWVYCTHDAATQSADGYFRILGRTDDVINVSGHRLGSKEIESAALTVASIAEAAVIPYPDPVKAHVPLVFVSTRPGIRATETVAQAVEEAIVSAIGPIARPRAVVAVEDLPKTRSGKIMRRVLRAIAPGGDPGDVTTLANPESVKAIQKILEKMHMQPDGPSGRSGTHPGPRP
jgi:acetyl-coenzyme A synthetase (EC 6.2.1.1)